MIARLAALVVAAIAVVSAFSVREFLRSSERHARHLEDQVDHYPASRGRRFTP